MFMLYKYELKKIFSQKSFFISFIFLLLFILAVSVTPIITGSIDNIEIKKELNNRVLDDSLFNEFYLDRDNPKYYDVKNFIAYCINDNDFEELSEEEIYNARLKILDKELNEDYLSDGEKQYWNNKEKNLDKPFTYIKDDGYSEVYNVVYVLNFAVLLLFAISITGIVADESSSGADQILFSSKYGKNKLFIAKILASLTAGFIVPTVIYGLVVGVNLFVYGTDGYNAALQIHMPTCLYSFSIGDSVIIFYFLLLTASFVYVSFAVLLSCATNNRPASTAAMVVLMFVSMFNIPRRFRILSQVWNDFPSGNLGYWTLREYRLINVFGHYFNSIEYSFVLWTLVSILFIFIAWFIYKKYEVEGK